MRVAYVCTDPGVPVFGAKGASLHVQGVLGALVRSGAEVTLLARRFGGCAPAELHGVAVVELAAPPRGDAAERERALAAGNAEVASALAAAGPFDLVLERHALFSWAAMEAAPVGVLEVNAPLVEEAARHRTLVDAAGARAGVARALAAAHAVVVVSHELAARLEQRCPEARGKLWVIANGVDPGRFGRLPPRRAKSFTVAFLGSLKPWHGLGVLAATFAALRRAVPEARLLVIGDGPGRTELEADLARRRLRAAATLTGAVDPGAVPDLLAHADAGLAPYPAADDHYFSPLKVLEYMAAGLPVVASRIGQIPELVDHDRSGLLCDPGDVRALAAALARLARDPGLAARLGAAGRADVLDRQTWDAVVARITRLAGAREAVLA